MMSEIPPGFVALYQQMPDLVDSPTDRYRLPRDQHYTTLSHMVALGGLRPSAPFRLIEGMGPDWTVLQLGEPFDAVCNPASLSSPHIDIPIEADGDSVSVCISCVPLWPVSLDRSNRFGVSIDGCQPVVCENRFTEWSAPWKRQVLENRKDFMLRLPLDRSRRHHTLSLVVGDPGQLIQQISTDYGNDKQ